MKETHAGYGLDKRKNWRVGCPGSTPKYRNQIRRKGDGEAEQGHQRRAEIKQRVDVGGEAIEKDLLVCVCGPHCWFEDEHPQREARHD